MFNLTEVSCLSDKDTMLEMIRVEDDNMFLQNCKTLIEFLNISAHKWERIRYCYKASEIATMLRKRCDQILTDTTNWKRRKNVESLKMQAWQLSEMYFGLQANQQSREAASV